MAEGRNNGEVADNREVAEGMVEDREVAKAWWRIERWRRGEAEGMVEDREAAK
jgi:hypothetical protein